MNQVHDILKTLVKTSVIEFETNHLKNKWELTSSQIEFNNYLKNRLKDMYTNKNQNKYNDLMEQNQLI